MDESQIKNVVEAALLAAHRPLTLDKLVELFSSKGDGPDRAAVQSAVEALGNEYENRGIEVKEVASGYRIQVRSSMQDWLGPLWEERAPRYTRALLETLALVAYRQPITRAEIEEVRGVAVSTNIVRTLMERGWVRIVGHRDVPGKPAMFGTTREFLDYFSLKKLEDLPTLAEIKDGFPELSPQSDFIDTMDEQQRAQASAEVPEEGTDGASAQADGGEGKGGQPEAEAEAGELEVGQVEDPQPEPDERESAPGGAEAPYGEKGGQAEEPEEAQAEEAHPEDRQFDDSQPALQSAQGADMGDLGDTAEAADIAEAPEAPEAPAATEATESEAIDPADTADDTAADEAQVEEQTVRETSQTSRPAPSSAAPSSDDADSDDHPESDVVPLTQRESN